MMAFRIKSANPDQQDKITAFEIKQMYQTIQETKDFAKAHLSRMVDISDLIKKFVANRDEYMVENTNFVIDQLTQYETNNLEGYNQGGYAYKNARLS